MSLTFDYVKTMMFMKAKMSKNGQYEHFTMLEGKSDILLGTFSHKVIIKKIINSISLFLRLLCENFSEIILNCTELLTLTCLLN